MTAGEPMHAPQVQLRRRTAAEQLHYLAGKLREDDDHRLSVSIALEMMADAMTWQPIEDDHDR